MRATCPAHQDRTEQTYEEISLSGKLATEHVMDDLDALIDVLPARVKRFLLDREDRSELLEIVLDLGRLKSITQAIGFSE